MWRCVQSLRCTVTLIAFRREKPRTAARSCPRRVAIIAPACGHPSCQRRRAASLFEFGRVGGREVKQGIGLLAALDRPCVTKSFFPVRLFHLSPITALPKTPARLARF